MKNAIVTGASTGIGKAISIELAKNGYFVFLIARDKTRLAQTKDAIEQNGGQAEIVQTDLGQINSIYSMIESIKNKVNRIDLLANIAGVWHGKESVFADTDYEDFDQEVILDTMSVGIIAPMLIVHGLVSLMPETSRIINIWNF